MTLCHGNAFLIIGALQTPEQTVEVPVIRDPVWRHNYVAIHSILAGLANVRNPLFGSMLLID